MKEEIISSDGLSHNSQNLGKLIITCGKICSGKSVYSKKLKDTLNAVVISLDEATFDLINNEQGEYFDIFSEKLIKYLTKKVAEIVKAGANVIFERGLWTKAAREKIRKYYNDLGIPCEIHYVCVDDETWKKNIEERNQRIMEGRGGSDFYLNKGLMDKLSSKWEEPSQEEIDVIYNVNRSE